MPEPEIEQLGAVIQAYARARWGDEPDESLVAELEANLDPDLCDRIDVLGLDGKRLLDVGAEAALAELEKLERAAAQEDARVVGAADRIRAQEIDHHYDPAKPPRRDSGIPPGKPRQSAGQGRRRQRGQR